MNRKLLRVLDEIEKTEARIAEWQGHLARLHEQRVQLEEKEIVRAVRAMGMTSRELVAAVDGIYAGKLTLAEIPGMGAGTPEGGAPETGNRPDASVPGSGAGMPSGMETGSPAEAESCPDTEGSGPEGCGVCGAGENSRA